MSERLAINGGKPVRDEFLVFGSPLIEEEEIEEVVATLRSAWIGTGPKTARFEDMFSQYKGSKHALAVNSCTAALHLSLQVIGLQPGDEVITTPMTFCATANAIIHAGATPVFVDCQRTTMNIDPLEIEKRITPETKAILPVHFAGRPCDMDAIMEIADKYSLKVIEDCAHAVETEYHGKKAGTLGDLGCFSFYVTKNIITGEGGMVVTDNEEYADRIRILGLHGMTKDAWRRFGDEGYKHYHVVSPGFKYNMTDMQASLGIHQFARIDTYWKRRKEIWKLYNDAFKGLPCIIPESVEENTRHALHLYTLFLDIDRLTASRDQILDALTKENIGVGVHYVALHLHPYYKETYGYKTGDFPNAEFISNRTISLPLSPKLSNGDVKDVIEAVIKVLGAFKR